MLPVPAAQGWADAQSHAVCACCAGAQIPLAGDTERVIEGGGAAGRQSKIGAG
ncbi:MAG: hypothetical protein HC911_05645 [Chloroflexaceae bacterium]|nr:hypothetical protein [Chloroflexaceae bacterium]